MVESDLCRRVRYGIGWDSISIKGLVPRSNVVKHGYRIDISMEKEEDIEAAKRILEKNHVTKYEDRIASSYSDTIEPGDRTLRVICNKQSVLNLEKMWERENENSRYGRAMKVAKGGR